MRREPERGVLKLAPPTASDGQGPSRSDVPVREPRSGQDRPVGEPHAALAVGVLRPRRTTNQTTRNRFNASIQKRNPFHTLSLSLSCEETSESRESRAGAERRAGVATESFATTPDMRVKSGARNFFRFTVEKYERVRFSQKPQCYQFHWRATP